MKELSRSSAKRDAFWLVKEAGLDMQHIHRLIATGDKILVETALLGLIASHSVWEGTGISLTQAVDRRLAALLRSDLCR